MSQNFLHDTSSFTHLLINSTAIWQSAKHVQEKICAWGSLPSVRQVDQGSPWLLQWCPETALAPLILISLCAEGFNCRFQGDLVISMPATLCTWPLGPSDLPDLHDPEEGKFVHPFLLLRSDGTFLKRSLLGNQEKVTMKMLKRQKYRNTRVYKTWTFHSKVLPQWCLKG